MRYVFLKKIHLSAVILTLAAPLFLFGAQQEDEFLGYRDKNSVTDVAAGVPLTTGNPLTYFAPTPTGEKADGYAEFLIRRDDSFNPKPHAVFFVHGLLGAESTFGHMENILKRDLGPYRSLRFKNLTYPTVTNGQNPWDYLTSRDLHPYHFAQIINAKIISFLVESGLDDLKTCQANHPEKEILIHDYKKCLTRGDSGLFTKNHIRKCASYFDDLPRCATDITNLDTSYSVIVHSQGGLTMASFLNSCYSKDTEGPTAFCNYEGALSVFEDRLSKELTVENMQSGKEDALEVAEKYEATELYKNIHLKKNAGTPKNFSNLISLGSPFWGSPTANYGQEMFLKMDADPENGIATSLNLLQGGLVLASFAGLNIPFPIRQVYRLAIGSSGLSWQRNLILQRNRMIDTRTGDFIMGPEDWGPHVKFNKQVPDNLRVYNVAGIINQLDVEKEVRKQAIDEKKRINDAANATEAWKFPQFNAKYTQRINELNRIIESTELNQTEKTSSDLSAPGIYENDVIVGAPEARLDFIYSLDNPIPGGEPLEGLTDLTTEYIPVPTGHVPLGPKAIGMADVNYNNHQDHPVYLTLINIFRKNLGIDKIANITSTIKDKLIEKLQNFTSEIKVISPIGYHRRFFINPENVKIEPENPDIFDQRVLPDKFYVQASGYNQADVRISDHYPQTFYHVGKFNDENSLYPQEESVEDYQRRLPGLGHKLNYTIDILGFKQKKFHQYVLPAMNSYKETYLTPYLPFPANKPTGRNTFVARVPVSENESREFYINTNGDLSIKSVYEPSELNCHIGLLGQPSPPRFRFKSIFRSDYRNHPSHVAAFENDNSITVRNFESGLFRNEAREANWYWYAPHKNIPLIHAKRSSAPHFDPLLFIDLQNPVGTAYEIIGRYTEGFVDPIHGHGRNCTQQEAAKKLPGCRKKSLDLYLVTSPDIREQDNVSIENIGLERTTKTVESHEESYTYSHLKGLRWIPVKDLDVIQPHQKLEVNVSSLFTFGTSKKATIPGNKCLWQEYPRKEYFPTDYYFEKYHYPYSIKSN
tara:strand:- start:26746 stop:29871 length:3126 start_codon:yes stop_codon:yes gene_type:complete